MPSFLLMPSPLLLRLILLSCPFLFSLFPFALPPLPGSLLLAGLKQIPRPRAWDERTDDRFAAACGRAICLLLIVPCRSLACARSLLSRLRFGFSSRVSFFPACRVGSCPLASGPVLASPRVPRPVRFLLRALLSVPASSVGFGRLVAPACSPFLVLADGVGRVIPSVRFLGFAPSASAFSPLVAPASRPLCSACLVSRSSLSRRSSPRLSVCLLRSSRFRGGLCSRVDLAPFRSSPRLACRRAGRRGAAVVACGYGPVACLWVPASAVSARSRVACRPLPVRRSACLPGGVVAFSSVCGLGFRRPGRAFLAIRLAPRLLCRWAGRLVSARRGYRLPACFVLRRAFVSIVCCLSLFVYIVP